jgi:hypothetical protein
VAGYTVVNLKQVEDSAPRFGLAPSLEARFARDALALERSGLGYQRLAPNFRTPFGHSHREQEEVYVVVGGSGRAKLGDEVVELGSWDAVRVAAPTTRAFEAGPDGLELLVFGAPRVDPAIADVESHPGWWAD